MKQLKAPQWMGILVLSGALVLAGLIAAAPAVPAGSLLPEIEKQPSTETSAAAFDQMMEVVAHKRCVNCHPSGDQPNQGEVDQEMCKLSSIWRST